jgi:hypothetical protein
MNPHQWPRLSPQREYVCTWALPLLQEESPPENRCKTAYRPSHSHLRSATHHVVVLYEKSEAMVGSTHGSTPRAIARSYPHSNCQQTCRHAFSSVTGISRVRRSLVRKPGTNGTQQPHSNAVQSSKRVYSSSPAAIARNALFRVKLQHKWRAVTPQI